VSSRSKTSPVRWILTPADKVQQVMCVEAQTLSPTGVRTRDPDAVNPAHLSPVLCSMTRTGLREPLRGPADR